MPLAGHKSHVLRVPPSLVQLIQQKKAPCLPKEKDLLISGVSPI